MSGTGSQPGRPLMVDVARLAGVSHQTVPRVLNDLPNVSPKTRAGVMAAIRDLGVRPNAPARTVVTGRTNALGVISFDTTLFGPASVLYGIELAAHPAYSVAISSLRPACPPSTAGRCSRLSSGSPARRVEGVASRPTDCWRP